MSSNLALLVATLCLVGCGGPSGSGLAMHDLAGFSIGVDVDTETRAVTDNLTSRGFVLGSSQSGDGYRAFDASHPDGRTLVRVITQVGIAIALDVPTHERDDAVRLRVVAGITDLVVTRIDSAWDRECSALLRPEPDGRVKGVPIELDYFGEGACVEEIRDLDEDGHPEMLTRSFAERAFGDGVPEVPGVLVAREGGYRRAGPGDCEVFWNGEEARRRSEADEARRALDVPRVLRLAVELALVVRGRGGAMAAQVTAFDGAIAGLVLSAEEARGALEAREHIADGWPE